MVKERCFVKVTCYSVSRCENHGVNSSVFVCVSVSVSVCVSVCLCVCVCVCGFAVILWFCSHYVCSRMFPKLTLLLCLLIGTQRTRVLHVVLQRPSVCVTTGARTLHSIATVSGLTLHAHPLHALLLTCIEHTFLYSRKVHADALLFSRCSP